MSFVTCDSVDLTYVTMDTIMIGAVFFFSPAKNTHRKGLWNKKKFEKHVHCI